MQDLLVIGIIAVAAVYLVRRHIKKSRSGQAGCGCGSDCAGCSGATSSECSEHRE